MTKKLKLPAKIYCMYEFIVATAVVAIKILASVGEDKFRNIIMFFSYREIDDRRLVYDVGAWTLGTWPMNPRTPGYVFASANNTPQTPQAAWCRY